jgi:hypothetical protein
MGLICGTCRRWLKVIDPSDLAKREGDCFGAPPTAHPVLNKR